MLHIQAINEMEQIYTRPQFGEHLVRFETILQRSTMVSAQDKQSVEAYMIQHEYDSLIDENRKVQERIALAEARGMQRSIVNIVKTRFPALVELAQEQVVHISNLEDLDNLLAERLVTPSEATARWLLNRTTGQPSAP